MSTPRSADVSAERSSFVRTVLSTILLDVRIAAFSLLANTIAGSVVVPRVLRIPLLRLAGVDIGRAHVWPGVVFATRHVQIGRLATINRGCFFDSIGGVRIGERVHVAYQVRFVTAAHHIGDSDQRCGPAYALPITVEDGSWIGAGSIVLAGVTIGRGCVIAAGSVVRSDCEPNGLYAGVPARRVRDLTG